MREYIVSRSGAWDDLKVELIDAQDGSCAICLKKLGEKCDLDHCHRTGFIRGVLCHSCNTKLGWFENNSDAVLSYLKASGDWIERDQQRLRVRLAVDEVRLHGVNVTLTRARETSSRHQSLPERADLAVDNAHNTVGSEQVA